MAIQGLQEEMAGRPLAASPKPVGPPRLNSPRGVRIRRTDDTLFPMQSANRDRDVAIIGLGYVGLPLCLAFARGGAAVLGVDLDREKADSLNAGTSYIKHLGDAAVAEVLDV
jgi:hypothetical protein